MGVRKYTFTKGAEADLDEIHERSREQYGRAQTNKFIAELKKAAEFAANNIGKVATRGHLTGDSGLSLYPVNNHFLAYRPVSIDHIVIIAIFRQSRDVAAHIAAEAERFQNDFREIERRLESGEISLKARKTRSR